MPQKKKSQQIRSVEDLLSVMEQVFADMNVGILIYHLEDAKDERKLRFIYANREAAIYTRVDLQPRIGKYILDAFPSLRQTELPRQYFELAKKKGSRQIGVVKYADEEMQSGAYAVKAFSLPADCVCVLFEDVAIRKQVDEMMRKQTDELRARRDELAARQSKIEAEIEKLRQHAATLRKNIGATVSKKDLQTLDKIIDGLSRLK